MLGFYTMWMKQVIDAKEKVTYQKELFYPTLKTNEYVPFVDNGLDDIMKAWAKNK
jgi:hypothetical protein